jgi:citrate/tricarballylate utilization protein
LDESRDEGRRNLPNTETVAEASRLLQICNACRYCEGYCAVFPAMELRRAFTSGDVAYLANLCHDCRGCYFACQYAPPHEFALNLPQVFARARAETYQDYAWPKAFAGLFRRNGLVMALSPAMSLTLVLLLTISLRPTAVVYAENAVPGAFYAVIPEAAMIAVALITFGYGMLAMAVGAVRFWRDCRGAGLPTNSVKQAFVDVLTLRNLGGGGHGCNDRNESFSTSRRRWHQFLMYGFLLCFASTCSAAFYEHVLGVVAPFAFNSVPVLLGTAGGIGMVVGAVGLWQVKISRDPAAAAEELQGADYGLLALMFLSAATGLVLLVLRETRWMGMLLAVHLGVILSFFVVLPYSKFVHGIYRAVALLRNGVEQSGGESGVLPE